MQKTEEGGVELVHTTNGDKNEPILEGRQEEIGNLCKKPDAQWNKRGTKQQHDLSLLSSFRIHLSCISFTSSSQCHHGVSKIAVSYRLDIVWIDWRKTLAVLDEKEKWPEETT
jgi:hypothetical protein